MGLECSPEVHSRYTALSVDLLICEELFQSTW
uniref:Uncharacterized protein n=1 Tax=Anguilla anguilla TaxID=7936 RepID=A0A0E9UCI4_ANGAN